MLSAFHRAIVHLPIGFFMMVLLIELIAWQRSKTLGGNQTAVANMQKWLGWMWLLVVGSSIVALISGTLLQNTGYYAGKTFSIHQFGAYGFTLLCLLAFVSHQYLELSKKSTFFLKIGILPIVIFVGHAGGELSAGPEVLGITPEPEISTLSEVDTPRIYPHVIKPIFETKCTRCHNQLNSRGGIAMDSPEALLTDSLGDPVIYPGSLERSLGYQRMILSPWDQHFMPPSGPPVTYHEKRLVEWWIMENTPFEASLAELNLPGDILGILQGDFNYSTGKRAFYENIKAAPIESETLKAVAEAGWKVSRLAQQNHFLDVHRKGALDSLSLEHWQVLEQIANNIVWLDLSNQSIPTQAFDFIGNMPNLYRLQLQNTNTKDEDLSSLSDLKYLNTLNLFGTPITDKSMPHLLKLDQLEMLFIGNTRLQESGLDSIQQLLSGVSVN